MAEDQGKQEEKFDFTPEGEAPGYISLDQAGILAIRTARETPGEYGSQFQDASMVFQVVEAIESEDFYTITLSFRPRDQFSGAPGQEQFFIEKEGTVAVRQVLSPPSADRRTASQDLEVQTSRDTEQSDAEQFAEGLGDIVEGSKGLVIALWQLLWVLMSFLAPLRWLFSRPIHLVKWCFRNEAVRDTAHSKANTYISGTSRLRTISIKIASAIVALIVGLWAGLLWLVTIGLVAVALTLGDETPLPLIVWLYPVSAIASTIAVVLMSKMNKPKANAIVVEAKFRAGPLIRLILIGVLITGSVIPFVIPATTASVV